MVTTMTKHEHNKIVSKIKQKQLISDNADFKTKDFLDSKTWNNISVALHIFLPVAGLLLFWGRRDLFGKLLMQIDRSCVAVFCPSFSKRERLLKWATGRLPSTWSSHAKTLSGGLSEFWRDGSLLCTLINSAIPGACPNPHRHWNKPISHGQALAYKYLGVVPAFTEKDFAETKLTGQQERNLLQYLCKVQGAINKLSERDDRSHAKYCTKYVARGMGLFTGEQERKTVFYIYASVNCKKFTSIIISIKGPYNTFGRITIAPFDISKNKRFKENDLVYKSDAQNSLLKTISCDFKRMINTVDSEGNDIPIEAEFEGDRVRVTFIPKNSGIYELCIVSDGELLKGSPFNVHVTKNSSGIKDTLKEDYTNKKIPKNVVTKRKILSRVIDFIDEKLVVNNIIKPKQNSLVHIEEDAFTSDDEIADINQNLVSFKTKEDVNRESTKEKDTCDEGFSDCSSSYECEIKNKIKIFQEHILKNSQVNSTELQNTKNTSPICPDHIAPEVDIKPKVNPRLSFNNDNNKTRSHNTLSQQNSMNTDETSSVLSENESDVGSESSSLGHEVYRLNQKHTNLNVLNVLNTRKQKNESYFNTIKKNTNSENSKNLSFEHKFNFKCSLPNLNNIDDGREFKRWSSTADVSNLNFKERVEYWNKICSQNDLNKKATDRKIDGVQNYTKNIGVCETLAKKLNNDKNPPVAVIKENVFRKNSLNKSKEKLDFSYSLEENLDDMMFMSVKDRKALLLREMEREHTEKGFPKTLPKPATLPRPPKTQQKNNVNLTAPTKISNSSFDDDKSLLIKKIQKFKLEEMKARFRSNQTYFKHLEHQNDARDLKRRHSLDSKQNKRATILQENGRNSLNFPNVSKRFSIENLYDDIFGDKKRRGSFRGSPNKKAVADALASLKMSASECNFTELEENDIKFNIFIKKRKYRQRESVKSLFDVNY